MYPSGRFPTLQGHIHKNASVPMFIPVFKMVQKYLWINLSRSSCHLQKHSIMHNNCIYIGFIKISKCHMAGELIGHLRLLRLRDILRATIASKEFKDIRTKSFWKEVIVLENNDFWKYLFTLCHSIYAPMCIL
jgi:hypothetical protein